ADEFVNSVMSFSYEDVPEVSFGPYFGTTVEAMYAEASTFEGGNEIVHAATMTLKLKKHLKAKVTVESEFLGCAAGRAVDIYKLIDKNTGRFVKTGITNQAGTVTIKLPDKKGTYFADAEEVLVDSENLCETAQSFAKKHKH
ncbi:MAG: hypothetical protein ACRDLB_16370, partial [Actinomycetota bacterium]